MWMPIFITKFLENRNFRVRLGSTFSDVFDQEMGVPQGSILSVTLFSLKINSLAKVLSKDVEGSLYVDDFLMSYRSNNTRSCERQLQGSLKKQKRSTEGCSKFKSPDTRQVQERLVSTLEHMQVPKWDRTRCPEE